LDGPHADALQLRAMNPEVPTGQGLLLQAIGILPLAFLTFLLGRSIQRPYLRFWWPAWTALAGSLFALYLARWLPQLRGWLEASYFFGEYVFGGLLVAGCRSLAGGTSPGRRAAWLLAPALALALLLSRVHAPFAVRFIPQAAVMGVLFGLALRELRRGAGVRGGIGTSLLKASLLAQALFFLHYVPVLSWAAWNGHGVAAAYPSTAAVFDLLFETLLGLATVVVVLEREHHDLEQANAELREARGKLEALARVDPLTSSLNRHAFYSMVEGSRDEAGGGGCVAVADLDSLKAINDGLGHAAGDAAIRAVARAIRQVVRADDLVFRWGGDEFLIVLFSVSEEEAASRLAGLDSMLAAVPVPDSPRPVAVSVSTGVAAFTSLAGLEPAVAQADARMYRCKEERRRSLAEATGGR
jgi:diguanylate cyclase (GGDEF)-like protein